MASGFSFDQKRAMILDSILPMLRNDIAKVCDATCALHGRPGSAPNFTAALICLVACEVMGRLASGGDVDDDEAAVEFIRSMDSVTGDPRYRHAAKPLFAFFRHGLAHSFLPKQAVAMKNQVVWATEDEGQTGVCLLTLRTPAEAAVLARLRVEHLKVTTAPPATFVLIPQVLAADILTAIDAFDARLAASDSSTAASFDAGFEKWWGRSSSVKGQLDDSGRKYLGL